MASIIFIFGIVAIIVGIIVAIILNKKKLGVKEWV